MTLTRLSHLALLLLLLVVVLLAGGHFCGKSREEARGRDLMAATIRADFLATWTAYKKARLAGDVETDLEAPPAWPYRPRAVRDGNVYLIHRKAAEREARTHYRVFEHVEGPYVFIAPSGCCIWAVTKTKMVPDTRSSHHPMRDNRSNQWPPNTTAGQEAGKR